MPFDPLTDLPSLVALWECDSGTYQNTSLTTPATANGAAVKGWADRTANGNNLIEATVNPVLEVMGGSVTAVKFSGAQKLTRTLAASIASGTSFTVHALASVDFTSALCCLIGQSTSNAIFLAAAWTTGAMRSISADGTDPSEDGKVHLLSVTITPTQAKFYADGVLAHTVTQAITIPTITEFKVAECASNFARCNILALSFASAVHTASDILALYTHYRSKFTAAWPLPTNLLIWDCNSLGAGQFVGLSNQTVPYLSTQPTLLGAPAWLNCSRGGYTATQMVADLPARLTVLAPQKQNRCCLILWDGRNDMVVGALTPRQAADKYRDYCTLAKTLGVQRVAVMTMLPTDHNSAGGADSAWNTANRVPFNNFVMAEWPTYADAIIPVHLDPIIGIAGANTNTTYYNPDGVHMKLAGNQVVAQWARAAVDTLIGGQTMGRFRGLNAGLS